MGPFGNTICERIHRGFPFNIQKEKTTLQINAGDFYNSIPYFFFLVCFFF